MCDFSGEIDKSIDLLLKVEQHELPKKVLFDKGKTVYLQIRLFKIPFLSAPKRKFLKLKHSVFGDDPEICLFVPNKKTGINYTKSTDELIEFCVDYYSSFLEKHQITQIKTIIPVKQLKTEYGSYELRRKLAHRFDIFLCKNSLLYNPSFLSGLGKIFRDINKEPLGISFPKNKENFNPEFKENIKKAICTSTFYIKPFSDNYTIPFGTLAQTILQLKENLRTVLDQVLEMIPGGLGNVRAMYLWPSQSKTIPFYFCSNLPKNLSLTYFSKPKNEGKKKRREKVEIVQGEISTQPGKKVTVMPSGDVFVTNHFDGERQDVFGEESGESFDEDSDTEEKSEKNKKLSQTSENESEDDEIIEKMEKKLMGKRGVDKSAAFDSEIKRRRKNREEIPEAKRQSKKVLKKSKNRKLKKKKNIQLE